MADWRLKMSILRITEEHDRDIEVIAEVRCGCRGVSLGTFDFQARLFYEGQGYRVFGELADFPAGHTHFQLAKRFDIARSDERDIAHDPSL